MTNDKIEELKKGIREEEDWVWGMDSYSEIIDKYLDKAQKEINDLKEENENIKCIRCGKSKEEHHKGNSLARAEILYCEKIHIGKNNTNTFLQADGRHFKTNYWELFYPDGTSSIMNYNPEEQTLKKVEELKENIENAQEDYGNLDWISKEQAIRIIDKIFTPSKSQISERLQDEQRIKEELETSPEGDLQ